MLHTFLKLNNSIETTPFYTSQIPLHSSLTKVSRLLCIAVCDLFFFLMRFIFSILPDFSTQMSHIFQLKDNRNWTPSPYNLLLFLSYQSQYYHDPPSCLSSEHEYLSWLHFCFSPCLVYDSCYGFHLQSIHVGSWSVCLPIALLSIEGGWFLRSQFSGLLCKLPSSWTLSMGNTMGWVTVGEACKPLALGSIPCMSFISSLAATPLNWPIVLTSTWWHSLGFC